jgi:hypothetical protein
MDIVGPRSIAPQQAVGKHRAEFMPDAATGEASLDNWRT